MAASILQQPVSVWAGSSITVSFTTVVGQVLVDVLVVRAGLAGTIVLENCLQATALLSNAFASSCIKSLAWWAGFASTVDGGDLVVTASWSGTGPSSVGAGDDKSGVRWAVVTQSIGQALRSSSSIGCSSDVTEITWVVTSALDAVSSVA